MLDTFQPGARRRPRAIMQAQLMPPADRVR